MPEFTTVLVQEAQLRTIPGRQGKFINEFADYIQQVPKGQAGWLKAAESENPRPSGAGSCQRQRRWVFP